VSQELAILYEVQRFDTEIASLNQALAGLDPGAELQAEIAAAESELSKLLNRHHATEAESLDRDLALKTLEEKRAKFKAQLYGGTVRNPRQLTDLEGEVQMLSREIGKIEDRILELMDSLEQERAEQKAQETRLAEMRARLAQVQGQYAATSSRLRTEVGETESRRAAAAGQVPVQLLKRYEQLRARQANLGLVRVTGITCPGCRVALPSETLKSLNADRGTLTCENCGRLLFRDASAADNE